MQINREKADAVVDDFDYLFRWIRLDLPAFSSCWRGI